MDFSLGSLKSGPGLIFIAGSDKLDTPRNATWISHMMVSKRYILLNMAILDTYAVRTPVCNIHTYQGG